MRRVCTNKECSILLNSIFGINTINRNQNICINIANTLIRLIGSKHPLTFFTILQHIVIVSFFDFYFKFFCKFLILIHSFNGNVLRIKGTSFVEDLSQKKKKLIDRSIIQ